MTAPSPPALRMRRSRQRARRGDVIVSLDVGPKVTADLVVLGWVPAHVCGDKDVLAHALTELVERAIEVRVTPALSSPGKVSFMLEIQRSTIAKAFRRFAGRALAVTRNSGPDRWYIP